MTMRDRGFWLCLIFLALFSFGIVWCILVADYHLAFTPVCLGIGTRIELERQIDRTFLLPALLAHIAAHGGLAADIALGVNGFIHLVTRVALLAWQVLVLFQQAINSRFVGTEHRCRSWCGQGIGTRLRRLQCLSNRWARVTQLPSNLPDTFAVDEVGSSNPFTVFHLNHLLLRYPAWHQ
jgi:hypothetical protein